jgi:hypothetical protein
MSEQPEDNIIEIQPGDTFEVLDEAGRFVDVVMNYDGSVTAPTHFFTTNFTYSANATAAFRYGGLNQFVKREASDTNGIFKIPGSDDVVAESAGSLRERINAAINYEVDKGIAEHIASIDNSKAEKSFNH